MPAAPPSTAPPTTTADPATPASAAPARPPSRPPPSGGGGVSWNTRALDWSGATDLQSAYALLLEAGAAAAAAGGRVRVAADLDPAGAVGLWVAVRVPPPADGGGPPPPAALYLTVTPLDDDAAAAPGAPPPFAVAPPGTAFRAPDAPRPGGWLNYRVTLLGGVAPDEAEVLWPNMVLHGDRAMHNLRSADDVVAFLAVATRGDVVSHALNLKALAELRGRDAAWCWDLLAQRWGAEDLKALGVGLSVFDGLPRRGGGRAREEAQGRL